MLFDLRSRRRRRTVQATYLALAVLMGAGLVGWGIGSNMGTGGLIDGLFGQGGGGDSTGTKQFVQDAQAAERQATGQPRSAAAWAELANARFALASAQRQDGKAAEADRTLRGVIAAWDRYIALDPKPVDPGLAAIVVQAHQALKQPAQAVAVQERVTEANPRDPAAFAQLAALAYQAGQTRKGDLASQRAVELSPRDQRAQVREQLQALKARATQPQGAQGQSAPAPLGG
jgi:tetratricopeptide (TPR) repeat protein